MKVQRHLTLREARMIREFTDASTADVLAIQLACAVTKEEAEAFFDSEAAGTVGRLLHDIMERSGLTEAAQFPDTAVDDVQPPRPVE